jgi:hypothetical protein
MKLVLAFIFATSPVFACNDGGCGPDRGPIPEPEPPTIPSVPVPVPPPVEGDTPHVPYVRQYFAVCTCDKFRVGWGFETKEFREQAAKGQCLMLREKRKCDITSPDLITPLK